MSTGKIGFNKFLFSIKHRLNFVIIIISVVSLLFIFSNIIDLNIHLGISNVLFFDWLFQLGTLISTIFAIIFLPSYPIFFFLWKKNGFNILEKLSLTIIMNLSFYVLVGYIGYFLGFSMTAIFFFITLSFSYFTLISLVILTELKNRGNKLLKTQKSSENNTELIRNFSFSKYIKTSIPRNVFLLLIFLFLLCTLFVVQYSYFFGTDAWAHIYITKMITQMNFLPTAEYGANGIHIFSAVIQFFSEIDLIYLPRYFVFYTILISSLVFYNITMKIIKNQNLAIFGIFILQFTNIGFNHLTLQFWPTSLATITCLEIFFLLNIRLQNFIKLKKPSRKELCVNMTSFYSIIIVFAISAILTHSLITGILLISFTIIYLIYFIKDFNRGFDFILLCGLLGIFLIFYLSGAISEFFNYIDLFKFPWYYYVFGVIGGGAGAMIILWKIQNKLHFTTGRFSIKIKNKSYRKLMEDQPFLVYLLIALILIIFICLAIFLLLEDNLSILFFSIEVMAITISGFWGVYLYQNKPRGMILGLWLLSMVSLLIGVMIINPAFSSRILILLSPLITLGFVAYTFKLIKTQAIHGIRAKVFIMSIVILSFFAFFYNDLTNDFYEVYDVKKREITPIQWFSNYNSEKSIIQSEIAWSYMFIYYDYPFSDNDISIEGNSIHYFFHSNQILLHPENHIDANGINILQQLKKELNSDFFILLDDLYIYRGGGLGDGRLTPYEMQQYNTLNYLNRIMSSSTGNGKELPFFWVI